MVLGGGGTGCCGPPKRKSKNPWACANSGDVTLAARDTTPTTRAAFNCSRQRLRIKATPRQFLPTILWRRLVGTFWLARGIGLLPAHSERLAHLSDQGSRPLRRKVTCGDNGLTDRPGHYYVFSRRSNAKPRTTASSPKRARTLSTACSASAARPSMRSPGSA